MVAAKHIAAVAVLGCLEGCLPVKTLVHNFADLGDHKIFANRPVPPAAKASHLRRAAAPGERLERLSVPDGHGAHLPLEDYLDETRTVAFVVLLGDQVVYERYARGYDERSLLNSFSIAKAIVATLAGIAVAEGRIPSLDARVGDLRPGLSGSPYGAVRLASLLTMTSGMADPPTVVPGRAQYYYGEDLHETVSLATRRLPIDGGWRYSEADVQVLGYVLEAAVGKRLSMYLAEKLWVPLGMEAGALWSLDREGGMEKAFCCISARARDFARFGLLYARGGRWHGRQLLPADWASIVVLPAVSVSGGYRHRHLWWVPPGDVGDFYAYGHDGQYLYVNPKYEMVIVKFSQTKRQDPVPMFRAICARLGPAMPGSPLP
jgi:CubicO group peptidase (beta-lactamase class C family)